MIGKLWPVIRWGPEWDPNEEQAYSRSGLSIGGYSSVAWTEHTSMSYWFYGSYMSYFQDPLRELMNG